MAGSAIPGFYTRTPAERLREVRAASGMTEEAAAAMASGGIGPAEASRMVENAVGTFGVPLGIATNFIVNGREVLVPMCIEEPSVVAAASRGAKAARPSGGFSARYTGSVSRGQIQLVGAADPAAAARRVEAGAAEIVRAANSASRTLPAAGRGARAASCRVVEAPSGPMLVAEIEVDTGDAMGANAINSMCEAAAPVAERLSGGRALLRILSNDCSLRRACCTASFPEPEVGGPGAVRDMVLAYEMAAADPGRAVTHNKGVLNGAMAVAAAAGQDGRAVAAAAGAWAARGGSYAPLTEWSAGEDGSLLGRLEMPAPVGTVGGITGSHPAARACLEAMGAGTAAELACIMAAVGLAQNYSALHALVTDGIQRGHMRLHAANVAASAGAPPGLAAEVAGRMAAEGRVSAARAREILGEIGGG